MKKKECPGCAFEVHVDSETCPICGYDFPSQPTGIGEDNDLDNGNISADIIAELAVFERANYMKVLQSWKQDPAGKVV